MICVKHLAPAWHTGGSQRTAGVSNIQPIINYELRAELKPFLWNPGSVTMVLTPTLVLECPGEVVKLDWLGPTSPIPDSLDTG